MHSATNHRTFGDLSNAVEMLRTAGVDQEAPVRVEMNEDGGVTIYVEE